MLQDAITDLEQSGTIYQICNDMLGQIYYENDMLGFVPQCVIFRFLF